MTCAHRGRRADDLREVCRAAQAPLGECGVVRVHHTLDAVHVGVLRVTIEREAVAYFTVRAPRTEAVARQLEW